MEVAFQKMLVAKRDCSSIIILFSVQLSRYLYAFSSVVAIEKVFLLKLCCD